MSDQIDITEAAIKYGVDAKRLRGAVYLNGLGDPIGDAERDLVQDDESGRALAKWNTRYPRTAQPPTAPTSNGCGCERACAKELGYKIQGECSRDAGETKEPLRAADVVPDQDLSVSDFTEAEYQAAIPACCQYQTVKEHMQSLMLCWGLADAIRNRVPMDCSGCDLATRAAHSAEASHANQK